jgi:phospholipase/carboxylesterase
LLLGFSQGAIMSYNVIFTRPELVNGIAAMSGRMMDGIKPNVSKKALEAVQVFIAHGTQDQVIGVEHARTSLKYFNSIGMKPEYHEYQMAHTISPQTLSDVITWLKKTAP